LNELSIIDLIRETFRDQHVDLSDDVSFVRRGRGFLVFKTDMFVSSTDMPPEMTLRQAARKAVIACVSDMLCKGADVWGFMVSLGIPRSFAKGESMRLLSMGLKDASLEYEVPLLGGDVNEADDLVIDVSMAGWVDRMVRRGGAEDGDVLVATGPFGLTALGLGHLLKGAVLPPSLAKASLSSVYEPKPKKGLCRALIESGLVSASMDSSDGLAMTLNEMSKQSRKEFIMTSLPADRAFVSACSLAGLDPLDLVLHGGEEYEAVLSIPASKLRPAMALASKQGEKLYLIGRVVQGRAHVVYVPSGRSLPVEVAADGWVHLR